MELTEPQKEYLSHIGNRAHRRKMEAAMTWENPTPTVTIALLNTAYLFFLEQVIIINKGNEYRLLVINKDVTLYDDVFENQADANAAFLCAFGDKAFEGVANTEWTHFYEPDPRWLKKKLSLPLMLRHQNGANE